MLNRSGASLLDAVGRADAGDVPDLPQAHSGVDGPKNAHRLDVEADHFGLDPVSGLLEQLGEQFFDVRDLIGAGVALENVDIKGRVGIGEGIEVSPDRCLDLQPDFWGWFCVFAGCCE